MNITIKKIIEVYKYIVCDGQIISLFTEFGNNHFISHITVGAPLIDDENYVAVAICENSFGNEEFMFIYLCNTDKWSKKSKEYCSPFMHLYISNKDIEDI